MQIVARGHGIKNIVGKITHNRINDATVVWSNITRINSKNRHIQTNARLKDESEYHAEDSTDRTGNGKEGNRQASKFAQFSRLQTTDSLHNRAHDQSNKRHLDQAHKEVSEDSQVI